METKRKNKKQFVAVASLTLVVVLGAATHAQVLVDWEITQLTNSGYSNGNPQLSDSHVVWEGHDGTDWEIFLYDGSIVSQLTNNSYRDKWPVVSGSHVAWRGNDGTDYEIFYYNGSTVTQLTNNNYQDDEPSISGSHVVWDGYDETGEIFLYDGSTVTQLTNNSFHDFDPVISGSYVAWGGWDETDTEIFLYDGSTITQLTDNSHDDYWPRISSSHVVWIRQEEDGYFTLLLYEIGSGTTTTLADATTFDLTYDNYAISGSSVAFFGEEIFTDPHLYLYQGGTVTDLARISRYSAYSAYLAISGPIVAWIDRNLFLYDGSTTTQLTEWGSIGFPGYGVKLSGSNAVWVGDDRKIYHAKLTFGPVEAKLTYELIDKVADLNLQQGIDNTLDAKLDTALTALDDVNANNDVAAVNALDAFINAVEAQRGKKITDVEADTLIASAQAIVDLLAGQ